jgi:hypothetical protein
MKAITDIQWVELHIRDLQAKPSMLSIAEVEALHRLKAVHQTLMQQKETNMPYQAKPTSPAYDHWKWQQEIADIRASIERIRHMGGPASPPIVQPALANLPSPSEMSNALLWVRAHISNTETRLETECTDQTKNDAILMDMYEHDLIQLHTIEKVLQACIAQTQKSPD